MTLLRTGIHGHSGPGVIPVSQMVSGALGEPIWWNPDGATPGFGGSCVGAYRAISTAGSPWGPGPVNYAASLVNLANPGVNNLVEGNGAVPWNALTGWGFVAAALQYFDTGLIPANDQSWSMIIQFSGVTNNGELAGARADAVRDFRIRPDVPGSVLYANGQSTTVIPALLAGNLAVCGDQGYRNGVADGGAIVGWGAPSALTVVIGARRITPVAVATHITANIESIAIYNVTLTAPQVLDRATAMAAL